MTLKRLLMPAVATALACASEDNVWRDCYHKDVLIPHNVKDTSAPGILPGFLGQGDGRPEEADSRV